MTLVRCLVAICFLVVGQAAWAQDPLSIKFLRVEKAQSPLPPLVHLRIELENPAAEPRWLLLSLSRENRLPKNGQFAADPDGGLPLFVLEAKDDKTQARAAMVGFLGEPRFTAFLLPAQSKIAFDDFEFPSVEDLSELDWLEAKSLKVDGKTPLEKWLPVPLASTAGTKLSKDASWIDALRDEKSGEPRDDLPKDKVTTVVADVARSGRLQVEGYQAPARYYQAVAPKDGPGIAPGWSLVSVFAPVRPLKVEQLAFAPDGSWLAASLQTFKVVGLEVDKNRERVFPMGEKSLARFFAFSPEGHLLVKQATEPIDEDGNLDLADWSAGKVLDVLRFSSRITLGNIDHVPAPDGQKVAVAQRARFNLWDFVRLESTKGFKFPDSVTGFVFRTGVFSPDGRRFAAGFENPVAGGKAVVWDVASGDVVAEFTNKQNGLPFLAFSGDGKLLAGTGKQASAVWVWSVDDAKEVAVLREIPFSNISAMAMAPDGVSLALAATPFSGGDGARGIELFDVAKKQRIGSLPGLRQPVTALTFSRDSRRLAGGDALGAIRVWERK